MREGERERQRERQRERDRERETENREKYYMDVRHRVRKEREGESAK